MKALILNSGIGKRMGELTREHPKCMTPIGKDHTILSWQLSLLEQAGITDVVITTGPFAETLENYALERLPSIQFVHNPQYNRTNYIYSMYLAREFLQDDLILLHGDLVLEKSVLEKLLAAPKSAVAVEWGIPLSEKDFKARLLHDRVREIGVHVSGEDCVASQPVYRLQKGDMEMWLEAISDFCQRGETGIYAENALNTILDRIEMVPVALENRLCNEIDNPEDLKIVSRQFRMLMNETEGAEEEI